MSAVIETVSELVEALGGNKVLADLEGVTVAAVSNWKHEGVIPPNRRYSLYRECQRRGLNVSGRLFGEVEAA